MLYDDRRRAESFGADAERYEAARPRYPTALYDRLLDLAAVAPSRPPDVLDIGCGTGIASRELLARGCTVLGVEADPRMAAVARRNGAEVEVEVGAFEAWEPRGRRFDLAVCGQAWHWIDPAAGPAKAASALRPDGVLALFWNFGGPEPQLRRRLDAVYARVAPSFVRNSVSLVDTHGQPTADVLEPLRRCGDFDEPEVARFDNPIEHTTASWLALLPTHSDHFVLNPTERARLLDALGEEIDRYGGRFTIANKTLLLAAKRTGSTRGRPA